MTTKMYRKPEDVVATALRAYAERLMDDPNTSVDEAQTLDRALRSCAGISDIDVVWVRWRFVGQSKDWLTGKEMVRNGRRYGYLEQT